MSPYVAPPIDAMCVLIAPERQVRLAAVLLSYFHAQTGYVPVFEFPQVEIPYSPSAEIGKDGYFAHIIAERAAVAINNALAAIQPKHIVFLGMSAAEQSYMRIRLPPDNLIEIDSQDKFLSHFPWLATHKDQIVCRSSQISESVSKKPQNKKLNFCFGMRY